MKKVIALILCIVMVCSCTGIAAFAEEGGRIKNRVEDRRLLKDAVRFAQSDAISIADSARQSVQIFLTERSLEENIVLELENTFALEAGEAITLQIIEVKTEGTYIDPERITYKGAGDYNLTSEKLPLITIGKNIHCGSYVFSIKANVIWSDAVPEHAVSVPVEFMVRMTVECDHQRGEYIIDEASLFDEGAKQIYCTCCGVPLGTENIPTTLLDNNGLLLITLIVKLLEFIFDLFKNIPAPEPV